MGSVLCCLVDDGRRDGCFCLPWPLFNAGHSTGFIGHQRGDSRVAPEQGRISLTAPTQQESMDTFRCPPMPLHYDDPQFSHQTEHQPLVGHDKASTTSDESGSLEESKNVDSISNSIAVKDNESSVKYHSGGLDIAEAQVNDPVDFEDECPICLEEYHYENPKITLQCNHNYHLGCIYEWMERSQTCPVCAKVMLFQEDARS
ncbi:E3 ubiquitin-protein ligase At3g02290-like [Oryza brachyantha]|nr:E3 ubiquitin-protein ligase At3g02290-like [Oryza brachyantha]